ncbi:universal stress protein [Streptomyces sp. NPDC093225]|uniref:universal stress protein n=1 Tax=Streptomyces sp. NPDC093225 TaxID=3366034 RepID=UPI00381A4ACC
MEHPLTVGVDGSDSSLQAVDWAVDEAARRGLPLRLVHASLWERYEGVGPPSDPDRPVDELMAEHIVAACTERVRQRAPEMTVSGDVLPDDAVSALLRAGDESSALVIGSRGRGEIAGMLLGSVGLAVAAGAACPVVVVRGAEPNRSGVFGRVVVGVGDDPAGEADAVRFALRAAEVRGCALEAVRVRRGHDHVAEQPRAASSPGAHEELAPTGLTDALREAMGQHPGVEVRTRPVEGAAHRALLDASADADLVVVGARRRHGHLGRVTHALLHRSRCPVAVVPVRQAGRPAGR